VTDVDNVRDSTLIIIAVISALPAIIVAIINRVHSNKTRVKLDANTEATKAVLHQVQNDHPTNLRDDIDHFKDEVFSTLEKIEAAQGYLGRTVGTLLKDVRDTARQQKSHDLASALIVEQLRIKDEQLESEIKRHHPERKQQ
jgi:hypothetical protein